MEEIKLFEKHLLLGIAGFLIWTYVTDFSWSMMDIASFVSQYPSSPLWNYRFLVECGAQSPLQLDVAMWLSSCQKEVHEKASKDCPSMWSVHVLWLSPFLLCCLKGEFCDCWSSNPDGEFQPHAVNSAEARRSGLPPSHQSSPTLPIFGILH